MATLLSSGVNSPLYKALVETGLASDVTANNTTFMDPYPITFEATVAPGKSADFLVLDANPLADIAKTRSIRDVYLRGERVDRAALRERWKTQ